MAKRAKTESYSGEDAVSPRKRLRNDKKDYEEWQLWGPYPSERQWGTVREDRSEDGNCWEYFPHSQSHQRAYQWGEDGLLAVSDKGTNLCQGLVVWNGKDAVLKERLYGLTGPQGNHGEDVKECYYYLDNTPNHCHMRALYKYPQRAYPHQEILDETDNCRTVGDTEYELEDTGIFHNDLYWDIEAQYAKDDPYTILSQYTLHNRSPEEATIHVLPTIWFRNTWSWGTDFVDYPVTKPCMKQVEKDKIYCSHNTLGDYIWMVDCGQDGRQPHFLFTENETNMAAVFGKENQSVYTKDAFNRYIIEGDSKAVNPNNVGTKCAAHYVYTVKPRSSVVLKCCLTTVRNADVFSDIFQQHFQQTMERRRQEATTLYQKILPSSLSSEEEQLARQAYAGLLWSKQFYFYHVKYWLQDGEQCSDSKRRRNPVNCRWSHLVNHHIISMPDKWEFPWYASWDLAFHMIPFVDIDPQFAKDQLLLMLSDGYMHPNGQLPAYEFDFSDVNPPVHAWSCLYVYRQTRDRQFLTKCFNKLLLNFGWWVNSKDPHGNHLFTGGFLGLDNIAPFDRSKTPPGGGVLLQADATGWMAFYSLKMMEISLELAKYDAVYVDMATKFLEHFLLIANAMNNATEGLWNDEDGFYCDHLHQDNTITPLRVHSLVGIVPIFACCVLDTNILNSVPSFQEKLQWFQKYRSDLMSKVLIKKGKDGTSSKILLSLPTQHKLQKILLGIFSEDEFLSPFGIRSLSKFHDKQPYTVTLGKTELEETCVSSVEDHSNESLDGVVQRHELQQDDETMATKTTQKPTEYTVKYAPGESNTEMFGGNSNWRGPVWICMNFLIIQSLICYDSFHGDEMMVEFPVSSGNKVSLKTAAVDLCERLVSIFRADQHGRRPCHGGSRKYAEDPNWKELMLFYEYFHGNTGRGCGASHQTGWTALIINCLKMIHSY
ncbi:uncharacterized protein LOC144449715 [Glandiceps talaboti]